MKGFRRVVEMKPISDVQIEYFRHLLKNWRVRIQQQLIDKDRETLRYNIGQLEDFFRTRGLSEEINEAENDSQNQN